MNYDFGAVVLPLKSWQTLGVYYILRSMEKNSGSNCNMVVVLLFINVLTYSL